ncbi:MAG: type II toxin-antitoxin system RelE/ParE family toxin [Planctomycetota bacterium]
MSEHLGYTVLINRSAEKEMDRLPGKTFERVAQAILRLERDPRPPGARKLRGAEEYRLRVGPYRILYSVDDRERVVVVSAVGHRRDVYRGI